jgi:hypothetical protein
MRPHDVEHAEMRRALNCSLAASAIIAALWLLNVPDINDWATIAVVTIGVYWSDVEFRQLRSM